VSRTLGRWTRAGIIGADGRRILVRDVARLRHRVGAKGVMDSWKG
jgi:hypothetical protein